MRKNRNIITPLWGFLTEMPVRSPFVSTPINTSITGNSPSAIQNAAIFFSRLNIFLFNRMTGAMLSFLDERVPNAIELLIDNLDLQPISELIYRLYALYSTSIPMNMRSSPVLDSVPPSDVLSWLNKHNFYDHLARRLNPRFGPDLHFSIKQFISGLFSLPFPEQLPRDQILNPFLRKSWLDLLLENVFSIECDDSESTSIPADLIEEFSQSSQLNGIKIISLILSTSRQVKSKFNVPVDLDEFIATLIDNFDTFFDILKHSVAPPASEFLDLTSGKIAVFGRVRLCVVEMFFELISSVSLVENEQNRQFYMKFIYEKKLIPILVDSFFYFKQNSFLHEIIVKLVKTILSSSLSAGLPSSLSLLAEQLLKDSSLRNKIITAQRENDSFVERPRCNRLPFMGHLTLLSKCILDWEEDMKEITSTGFTVSLSASGYSSAEIVDEEAWREYCNKSFKETLRKDSQILGGIKPPISMDEMFNNNSNSSSSGSEVEGEEEDHLLDYNAIFTSGNEEQLARYFCQQIIGNIPGQFLFEADDEDDDEMTLDEFEHEISDDSDDDDFEDGEFSNLILSTSTSSSDDEEEEEGNSSEDSNSNSNANNISRSRHYSRKYHQNNRRHRNSSTTKSIEIPILLGNNDNFDEEMEMMFETSFSSFISSSEEESSSEDIEDIEDSFSDTHHSDNDTDIVMMNTKV